MNKSVLFLLLSFAVNTAFAQSFFESVDSFRAAYKRELLADKHSPVKADDTSGLKFYAPDKAYKVSATFRPTPDAKPFNIATHSGKTKPYRKYGTAEFRLRGKTYRLAIYQGIDLIKSEKLRDYLFIPFNDLTNYETTYAGGRYLDLRIGDIKEGRVVLDFNKAYNRTVHSQRAFPALYRRMRIS